MARPPVRATRAQKGKGPANAPDPVDPGPQPASWTGTLATRARTARGAIAYCARNTTDMAGFVVLSTILFNIFDYFAFGSLSEAEILTQRALMVAAFWVEGPDFGWAPDRAKPAARVLKAMFAAASALVEVFEALDPASARFQRDPTAATTSHLRAEEDATEAMLQAASAREMADAEAARPGGRNQQRPPETYGGGLPTGGGFRAMFTPQTGADLVGRITPRGLRADAENMRAVDMIRNGEGENIEGMDLRTAGGAPYEGAGHKDEDFSDLHGGKQKISVDSKGFICVGKETKAPTSSFELQQILREELAVMFANNHKDKDEWFRYLGHLGDLLMQFVPFRVVIAIDRILRKQWRLTGIRYTRETVNSELAVYHMLNQPTPNHVAPPFPFNGGGRNGGRGREGGRGRGRGREGGRGRGRGGGRGVCWMHATPGGCSRENCQFQH